MPNETRAQPLSLFGVRLPKYATPSSGEIPEPDMWRAIKETIDTMYEIIDKIELDAFDPGVARIYEQNLLLIKIDIEQSASKHDYKDPKYTGYEQVIERIKDCRAELGIVIRYHGKNPKDHLQALQAVNRLQDHLQEAQEYIDPIYDQLRPQSTKGTSSLTDGAAPSSPGGQS